ncbi:MAG: hypothetical protein H7242_02800 [Microbacteriaceae bacterium]|nr:hypothetical protein [Burkholderiaceae bacterium]
MSMLLLVLTDVALPAVVLTAEVLTAVMFKAAVFADPGRWCLLLRRQPENPAAGAVC